MPATWPVGLRMKSALGCVHAQEVREDPMEWIKKGNRQNIVIGFGAPLVLALSGKVDEAHEALVTEIAKIDPNGEEAGKFRQMLNGLADIGRGNEGGVGLIGYKIIAPGRFNYYYAVRVKGVFLLVTYRFQTLKGGVDVLSLRATADPMIYEDILSKITLFTDSISLTPNSCSNPAFLATPA